MVLSRGMDILAYTKFPDDDGIFADLSFKQKMPVRTDLRLVAVEFSVAEMFKTQKADILCLVKGVNRLFKKVGVAQPFLVTKCLEGKLKL